MTDKNELQVSTTASGPLHEAPMCVELADTFGLAPKQVIKVLSGLIKVPKGQEPATAAELIIVLSVMHQYGMNPMMKQIHAWRDSRGDLAVMMGYDGWTQKANEQPGFMFVSYEFGPDVPSPDGKGRACWEWVKATVHDSIRGDMVMFPVYLEEWYVPQGNYPGPWQRQTRHKMHVVTYRLAIREAYSIGLDIRDPEDFGPNQADPGGKTQDKLAEMSEGLGSADNRDFQEATATIVDVPDPVDQAASASSTETPEPPDVPCGASGCPKEGTVMCQACGAYFCASHVDNGDMCAICALDR